jgi:hypothetical protein
MARKKRGYAPLFEVRLSENCTVTPVLSWNKMHEARRKRKQLVAEENEIRPRVLRVKEKLGVLKALSSEKDDTPEDDLGVLSEEPDLEEEVS